MIAVYLFFFGWLYECFDIYFDYRDRKKKGENRFNSIFIDNVFHYGKYVLALFLLYATISSFIQEKKHNDIVATYGKFKDLKMSINTPVLVMGKSPFTGTALLSQGNGVQFVGNGTNINMGYPIENINLQKVNDQINIKAIIRDSKGDPVVKLSERGWEILNTTGIEYNNDETALEVTLGGRVVCQIQLSNDTVYYKGVLCNEDGQCAYSYEEGLGLLPKLDGTQRFILPNNYIIKPLFRYPRFQYCGVREPE